MYFSRACVLKGLREIPTEYIHIIGSDVHIYFEKSEFIIARTQGVRCVYACACVHDTAWAGARKGARCERRGAREHG
jgi:hypothetical protein